MKMKNKLFVLLSIVLISCVNNEEECTECGIEETDSTTTEIIEKTTYTYDVDSMAFIDKLNETGGVLVDVRQ